MDKWILARQDVVYNRCMKSGIKTYVIVTVVIIIVLVAVIWKQAMAPAPAQNSYPNQTSSAQAVVSTSGSPSRTTTSAPKTSAPVKSTTPSTGNEYVDDLTALRAAENSCKNSATVEYNQLYANSLENSSFESYYNSNTGICYMKATGKIRPAYATTTTSVMYFRNAAKNSLLMECDDSIGQTFADNEWKCVNKTTGQAIPLAEFNDLITSYTTH